MAELTKETVEKNLNNFGYKPPNPNQVGGAVTNSGIISQNGTDPIDANILNTKSYVVPPPVNTNTYQSKLGTTVGTAINTVDSTRESDTEEPAPKNASYTNRIAEIAGIQATQGEKTLKAQEEAGVFAKKDAARKLEDEMLAKSKSYDDKIKTIREQNPNGMYGAGGQGEISRLERQKNSELADLSIRYKVAAGDYNAAIEIADSKVKAEFEPLKNELETLKTLATLVENDMTESQKFQAESARNKKENEIKRLEDSKSAAYKTAIENDAPASVFQAINDAQDPNKVFSALKGYGQSYNEKLQAAKILKELEDKSGVDYTGNTAIDALSSVTGSLAENQRVATTKALGTALERADVGSVERVLKNTAKNVAGTALTTEITKRDIATEALKDLKQALVAYEALGKGTDFVKGGYEDIARKVGKTTDKDLAALETKIRLSVQAYRSAVSGAAFSESEQKEYDSVFPNKKNGFVLNSTIADTLIQSFENNNSSFYKSYYGDTPANIAKQSVLQVLESKASSNQRASVTQN